MMQISELTLPETQTMIAIAIFSLKSRLSSSWIQTNLQLQVSLAAGEYSTAWFLTMRYEWKWCIPGPQNSLAGKPPWPSYDWIYCWRLWHVSQEEFKGAKWKQGVIPTGRIWWSFFFVSFAIILSSLIFKMLIILGFQKTINMSYISLLLVFVAHQA